MLGKRIRAARLRAGLGQAALARLIGIGPITQYKYESGRLRPGLARLEKIATALSVTLDWLLNGRGPSKPPGRTRKPTKELPGAL